MTEPERLLEEVARLRQKVTRLRELVDRLTACPGCGRHPGGAHFCPGPDRERYVYQGFGGLESCW